MSEKRHWDIIITRYKPGEAKRTSYSSFSWYEIRPDERMTQVITAFAQPRVSTAVFDESLYSIRWYDDEAAEEFLIRKSEVVDIHIIAVPPVGGGTVE